MKTTRKKFQILSFKKEWRTCHQWRAWRLWPRCAPQWCCPWGRSSWLSKAKDKEEGLVWLAVFEANPNGFYAWLEFLLARLLNVRQEGRSGLASRLRSESEWILRVVWISFCEAGECPIRRGGLVWLAVFEVQFIFCVRYKDITGAVLFLRTCLKVCIEPRTISIKTSKWRSEYSPQ